EIREGAVCLNFSTLKNFAPSIEGKASVFVPRVGPMTIAMVLRNTLRVHKNAQHQQNTQTDGEKPWKGVSQ
ncbi:MAG: hypothetical protein AAGJ35_16355, partial [Myxococcota bacterium]